MPKTLISVPEAKTHFSRLLERVAAGEEAQLENLAILTADREFDAYDVRTIAA